MVLARAVVTFRDGGWAIEWRTYTASYVDSPVAGEARPWHCAGAVQEVPDGSWKTFRAMGSMSQGLPPKPVACDVKRRQ
jgi:hypothetical protein